MSISEKRNHYIKKWKRENVDRVDFEIPKGKRDLLNEIASKYNTSRAQLIVDAIENQYNIDLTNKK